MLNRLARRHAIVVIISDFLFEHRAAARKRPAIAPRRIWFRPHWGRGRCRRCARPIAATMSSPSRWWTVTSWNCPPVGRLVLKDAETGEMIEINTHDARKRRAFAERRAKHQAELLRLLRSANIDAIEVAHWRALRRRLGSVFRNARKAPPARRSMNTNSALIIPAPVPGRHQRGPAGFSGRNQAADRDSQCLALGVLDCRHPAAAGWPAG